MSVPSQKSLKYFEWKFIPMLVLQSGVLLSFDDKDGCVWGGGLGVALLPDKVSCAPLTYWIFANVFADGPHYVYHSVCHTRTSLQWREEACPIEHEQKTSLMLLKSSWFSTAWSYPWSLCFLSFQMTQVYFPESGEFRIHPFNYRVPRHLATLLSLPDDIFLAVSEPAL